ncbi:hypothetical protein [Parendozoicomonas haliclonae]|uniref:Uncharacterized protein n=1 Tax=Parendozoicomonas haliclonae TaxID=1960125 RepID=A0A1X7AKV1_9GAMM|nr:hypothetical protein [Parendozoicomonas haliclonae]SMA48376.1 hypothetical protein EHSB41UT_02718 [Parendozoicomonas haliclonae]
MGPLTQIKSLPPSDHLVGITADNKVIAIPLSESSSSQNKVALLKATKKLSWIQPDQTDGISVRHAKKCIRERKVGFNATHSADIREGIACSNNCREIFDTKVVDKAEVIPTSIKFSSESPAKALQKELEKIKGYKESVCSNIEKFQRMEFLLVYFQEKKDQSSYESVSNFWCQYLHSWCDEQMNSDANFTEMLASEQHDLEYKDQKLRLKGIGKTLEGNTLVLSQLPALIAKAKSRPVSVLPMEQEPPAAIRSLPPSPKKPGDSPSRETEV